MHSGHVAFLLSADRMKAKIKNQETAVDVGCLKGMVEFSLAHAKIFKNFLTPEGFLDVRAKALISKSCLLIFSIFISGPFHCVAGRAVWREETILEAMR
jgi:hypothetical protein